MKIKQKYHPENRSTRNQAFNEKHVFDISKTDLESEK